MFNNRMEVLKCFYDVVVSQWIYRTSYFHLQSHRVPAYPAEWMRYHPGSTGSLEQCQLNMISQLSEGHQQVFCTSEIPKPFKEQIFRASTSTKMFSCYIFQTHRKMFRDIKAGKGCQKTPFQHLCFFKTLKSSDMATHTNSHMIIHGIYHNLSGQYKSEDKNISTLECNLHLTFAI